MPSDTTVYPGMPYTLYRAKAIDVMASKLKCEVQARKRGRNKRNSPEFEIMFNDKTSAAS